LHINVILYIAATAYSKTVGTYCFKYCDFNRLAEVKYKTKEYAISGA